LDRRSRQELCFPRTILVGIADPDGEPAVDPAARMEPRERARGGAIGQRLRTRACAQAGGAREAAIQRAENPRAAALVRFPGILSVEKDAAQAARTAGRLRTP